MLVKAAVSSESGDLFLIVRPLLNTGKVVGNRMNCEHLLPIVQPNHGILHRCEHTTMFFLKLAFDFLHTLLTSKPSELYFSLMMVVVCRNHPVLVYMAPSLHVTKGASSR